MNQGIVCFLLGHIPLKFDEGNAHLIVAGSVKGDRREFEFCYCVRCKAVYIENRND